MKQSRKWWLSSLMWGLLLAAWVTLLFTFSSQTYEQQSIQPLLRKYLDYHDLLKWLPDVTIKYRKSIINSQASPYHFIEFLFRKGAHLFVYAAFAAIFYLFVRSFNRRRWFRSIMLTLVVVIAIPAMDEWNQLSSEHRTGNATDVLLDFAGGCAGLLVCLCVLGLIKLWRKPGRSRR